jgi:hypothetical protein
MSEYERIKKLLNPTEEPGLQYIAKESDYINEVINGYQMEVIKYGVPSMDKCCPMKMGELTTVVGNTTVGKTTFILWLASKLGLKGKKGLIYSVENRVSGIVKNLVRFQHGKVTNETVRETVKNFRFVMHKRQFTYKDMLEQGAIVLDSGFEWDYLIIDPYNGLKVEGNKNGHEYHYEAAEELRVFTMNNNKSIILNCHTNTESHRVKPDADGLTPIPLDSFVEGGTKFISKPDNVLVVHRQIRAVDKDKRYITQVCATKIRNIEYGGQITGYHEPMEFRFRKDWTGFDELNSYEDKFNYVRDYSEPTKLPF